VVNPKCRLLLWVVESVRCTLHVVGVFPLVRARQFLGDCVRGETEHVDVTVCGWEHWYGSILCWSLPTERPTTTKMCRFPGII
jgi:hypothetical protein